MATSMLVVDVSGLRAQGANREVAARALFAALSEVGFGVIVGHGIDPSLIANMRTAVRHVFATPRETLARDLVRKGNYRGYVPLGYFTPNSGKGKGDQYEAWKLHHETPADDPIIALCDLYGPNVWPRIDDDVRTPVLAYWGAMERLCADMLRGLIDEMGADTDYVMSCMEQPLTNMTLLNYPPTEPTKDVWGIHPHKDFNVLTVLAHDPVGGLEVMLRDGSWITADCPPEAMVVNVGDMLELWSGGRLISTPHRVFNKSGGARQSFPFFYKPRWDVTIEPLVGSVEGFERLPLHVGRSAADIWYSNWPDTMSTEPAQVLGNFQ